MITLQQQQPMLQTGYCVIADYNEAWLEQVLEEAAQRAGVRVPFKRDMAQAIMLYLKTSVTRPSIPLEQLYQQIERMLTEMGLPLIAQNLRHDTPPVNISLDSIAQQSPIPIFFYTELKRKIDKLRQIGLTRYRFLNKKECSILLVDRQRACPASKEALIELEAFITMGNWEWNSQF